MAGNEAEQAVRATLANRPAGVLAGLPHDAETCFAGLFNGALGTGTVYPGGLFIGKSECERNWPEAWEALREAGLVEWRLEEVPNHPKVGGFTTKLHWSVTDKGWEVRDDDLAWFRELMTAMRRDSSEDA